MPSSILKRALISAGIIAGLGTIGLAMAFFSQHLSSRSPPPPPPSSSSSAARFIVDTDIGPWPDDVGALSMLHTYADRGLLEIVAIMSNNRYEGAVQVIDAMNRYFNRSSIPIGVTKDPAASATTGTLGWPEYVLAHFAHPRFGNNSEAEDAVRLYRRLLATTTADQSITLLSIGYLTNLANLLATTADSYSTATGAELVRQKVAHLYIMAGAFPSGEELNIKDQPAAAAAALPAWPTPATFIGFEAGDHIACGGNLLNPSTNGSILAGSPVSKAFEFAYKAFGKIDGCYDETATLVAIRRAVTGHAEAQKLFFDTVPGRIVVYGNGTNGWLKSSAGNHGGTQQAYVRQKASVTFETIVGEINPLLVR